MTIGIDLGKYQAILAVDKHELEFLRTLLVKPEGRDKDSAMRSELRNAVERCISGLSRRQEGNKE